jgi:transposase-like protein
MPSHNGKRYPAEVKERAVRITLEAQSDVNDLRI